MSLLATGLAMMAIAAPLQESGPLPSVQAWSFNRFTAMQAIQMASQAGSSYIELYPGQKVGGDFPNAGMGPDMGADAERAIKAQLTKFNVQPIAFGVTGISRNEGEARKLFSWVKGMGIRVINTESTDAIDMIEKMVKEFDLQVGYHNHPRRKDDANYKVWDPKYIAELVKNRDRRIGACADTGHWVRSGIKPIDALKILKGRIVSSHLKDLHVFEPGGHDVPYGTGVSDIAAILAEFKAQKMNGPISVEYEHNWDANLADVAQCLGFVRGFYRGKK